MLNGLPAIFSVDVLAFNAASKIQAACRELESHGDSSSRTHGLLQRPTVIQQD